MAEFAYQTATIDVELKNGNTMRLTNADIFQDGLVYDKYCTLGDVVTLGTCVASEVNMKLDNSDGRFDDVSFNGAILKINVAMPDSSAQSGTLLLVNNWFIVDTVSFDIFYVNIVAYDYMTKLDVPFTKSKLKGSSESSISYSYSMDSCIRNIVYNCGYDGWEYEYSSEPISNIPNIFGTIIRTSELTPLENKITCRQFLSYVLSICGLCAEAYQDRINVYKLKYIDMQYSAYDLYPVNRYNSTISPESINTTGLYHRASDGTISLLGNTGHVIDYSDNPLITICYKRYDSLSPRKTVMEIFQEIDALNIDAWYYFPFSATVRPNSYRVGNPIRFWYAPLTDFTDETEPVEAEYDTIVTHITQKLNGPTFIAAEGKTEEKDKSVPTSGAGMAQLSDVFTNITVTGTASFSGDIAVPYEGLLKSVLIEMVPATSIAAGGYLYNTYTIAQSEIGAGWTPIAIAGHIVNNRYVSVYNLRVRTDDPMQVTYGLYNTSTAARSTSLTVNVLCIRTSL